MGVLVCDRRDCDNIMCDRVSMDHGYICDECFEELIHKPYTDIYTFMGTPKVQCEDGGAFWEGLVRSEFKSRFFEED